MIVIALYACLFLTQSVFAGIHGIYRTKDGKTLEVWREGEQSRLAINQGKQIFCHDTTCYFAYADKKQWRVFNVDAVKETLKQSGLSALVDTYMGEATRELKKAQIEILDTGEREQVGSFNGQRYQVTLKRGSKTHTLVVIATQEKFPLEAQQAILLIAERAGNHLAKENFSDFWTTVVKHFDAQHYAILKSDAFTLVQAEEKPLGKDIFKLPAQPQTPFIFDFGSVKVNP